MMHEQGTEGWLAQRVGKITGSRVGAILGMNPYSSEQDVLREMVREALGAEREFKGNAATDHGTRLEPVAIEWYESTSGMSVESTGFVCHDEIDWLGASPDGLLGLDGGIEVKCPYWAKEPYSIESKPYYWAQMQTVMEVCDLEYMIFICFISPTSNRVERVERDREWFHSVAMPKLEKFHKKFTDSMAGDHSAFLSVPAVHVDDDETKRMAELLFESILLKEKLEPIEAEISALKKKMGEAHGSFASTYFDLKRVQKKGSVDNKRLYADVGVEKLLMQMGKSLDDYRGEPVVSYSIISKGDV
jgi:putative phage-type endonuclease